MIQNFICNPVANVSEVKRVMKKERLGGTKKLKKLSVQWKLRLELGQQTSDLSSFDCGTVEHVRLLPLLLSSLKKSHGKNLDKSCIKTVAAHVAGSGGGLPLAVENSSSPL